MKRRTEIPSLPPPKKREPETVPEEGATSATEVVASETVYVWKALPVVLSFARVKNVLPFCVSQSVNGLGIAPLATELARRSLPLAGRLQYFKSSWVKIKQDPWVLETIQGYRVPFSQRPYQPYPPRALTHYQAEEALMQQEIHSMLEKDAIGETTPRGHGFLSTIFLVPKKDGGQRPVINLKSLNKFVYTQSTSKWKVYTS